MTVKTQRAVLGSTAAAAALALGLSIVTATPVRAADATQGEQCQALSQQMLDALLHGDSKSASKAFDNDMRSALPPDKLARLWKQVQQNFGDFKSRGNVQTMQVNGMDVVITPMQFSKTMLDAQVACNPQRQIAGFFLRPTAA
ncbi:DUF3887 domain-containing protein [Metallibacterium scheffleri]|uniref:DUF3887 domain-containing protein n=1 Tax=Metallibacterium scheffleri TaxID=993689 RepID=UPI0026ECCC2B|nr:DUF3887 domain-containing protein [Metallibacterium scheffleri]